MNFCYLSKYDDLLTDIFLDALYLWFETTKMNPDHRRPRIPCNKVLDIIQRNILENKKPNDAVAELLAMDYLKHYLMSKSVKQQQEFVQHMKRYLYMYMPSAGYEIGDTKRYRGNGKRIEACLIATKDWHVGDELRMCTGMIACLDPQQDMQLRKGNRDFSIMWSTRKGCSCLFLGPARFANHDCDSNCKFISTGQNSVTFKVIKEIKCGEELTVFYGSHYFGENNAECRCATCERRGEGAFAVSGEDEDDPTENKGETAGSRRSARKRKSALHEDFVSEPPRRTKRTSTEFPRTVTSGRTASEPKTEKRQYASVMSIEFLCGRESPRVASSPLDLLCDAADVAEYLSEKSSEGLTVMVNASPQRDSDGDRDDNSSDTKADSAISMSPHVKTQDEVDLTDDGVRRWRQEMDTLIYNEDGHHDDTDDWFDDVSELSSIASSELSLWSDDAAMDTAMASEPKPASGKSKHKEHPRNSNVSKPLECIACHRVLRREEISEQVGFDTSATAELATWAWTPSALFTDWRPKRCPRCERHFTIFRQEWPHRKAKRKKPKKSKKSKATSSPPAAYPPEMEVLDDRIFDAMNPLTPLSEYNDDEEQEP